jgi:hypothetical protein
VPIILYEMKERVRRKKEYAGFQQHELKKCISRGGKKIRIHHQQNHNQNQNNDFDIESANELKRSRSK